MKIDLTLKEAQILTATVSASKKLLHDAINDTKTPDHIKKSFSKDVPILLEIEMKLIPLLCGKDNEADRSSDSL